MNLKSYILKNLLPTVSSHRVMELVNANVTYNMGILIHALERCTEEVWSKYHPDVQQILKNRKTLRQAASIMRIQLPFSDLVSDNLTNSAASSSRKRKAPESGGRGRGRPKKMARGAASSSAAPASSQGSQGNSQADGLVDEMPDILNVEHVPDILNVEHVIKEAQRICNGGQQWKLYLVSELLAHSVPLVAWAMHKYPWVWDMRGSLTVQNSKPMLRNCLSKDGDDHFNVHVPLSSIDKKDPKKQLDEFLVKESGRGRGKITYHQIAPVHVNATNLDAVRNMLEDPILKALAPILILIFTDAHSTAWLPKIATYVAELCEQEIGAFESMILITTGIDLCVQYMHLDSDENAIAWNFGDDESCRVWVQHFINTMSGMDDVISGMKCISGAVCQDMVLKKDAFKVDG